MPDESYGHKPPADATIQLASDFVENKHYPLTKVVWGPNGGPLSHVAAAAPLPVSLPAGAQAISGTVDTELPAAALLADGAANPTAPTVGAAGLLWDETNAQWVRARANGSETTLLASAARTANTNSATQTNRTHLGGIFLLNVTAASGTGGLRLGVRAGFASANPYLLNYTTQTPITAVGFYQFVVYPGAVSPVSNTSAQTRAVAGVPLPRSWFGTVVHDDASSYTYALTYFPII